MASAVAWLAHAFMCALVAIRGSGGEAEAERWSAQPLLEGRGWPSGPALLVE